MNGRRAKEIRRKVYSRGNASRSDGNYTWNTKDVERVDPVTKVVKHVKVLLGGIRATGKRAQYQAEKKRYVKGW